MGESESDVEDMDKTDRTERTIARDTHGGERRRERRTPSGERAQSHQQPTDMVSAEPPSEHIRAYFDRATVLSVGFPVPLSTSPPARYDSSTTTIAGGGGRIFLYESP